MSYQGAKPGQLVYYSRNPWEKRELVMVKTVYKSVKDLVNNNSAVVMLGLRFDFPLHVLIKDLYKKGES